MLPDATVLGDFILERGKGLMGLYKQSSAFDKSSMFRFFGLLSCL